MKKFIRYFRIFNRSISIPFLIIFAYFVAYTILLLYSNSEITSFVAGPSGPYSYYSNPIRFRMDKMDEHAGQVLLGISGLKHYLWTSDDDHRSIQISTGDEAVTLYSRKKLEENPEGVIVPAGYREATHQDKIEINGQDLPIIGEDPLGETYNADFPLSLQLHPKTFARLELENVYITMHFEGLLSRQDMMNIVQGLEDQGLSIEDLMMEDFESKLNQQNKPAVLLSSTLIFLFIGLNILAIFNYVLTTRQKGLSILRTFGLSRRSGTWLIALEMTFYSLLASFLVLLLFFVLVPKLSQFYRLGDLLIFLSIANGLVFLATKLMARFVLDVPVGTLVKENWNE